MKKIVLIILVSIIWIGPSLVMAQGSVPDARATDTPVPADAGVAATVVPVAAPAMTSVVTPRPVLTTIVPIPTPRPTFPISPQPESLTDDQPRPLPEDWFCKYALTLLGVGGVALLSY